VLLGLRTEKRFSKLRLSSSDCIFRRPGSDATDRHICRRITVTLKDCGGITVWLVREEEGEVEQGITPYRRKMISSISLTGLHNILEKLKHNQVCHELRKADFEIRYVGNAGTRLHFNSFSSPILRAYRNAAEKIETLGRFMCVLGT
jgi:hypothetical protein